MVKRRVHIDVNVDTVQHAITIRDNINNRLTSDSIDIYVRDVDIQHWVSTDNLVNSSGSVHVFGQLRLNVSGDGIRVRNYIQGIWTSGVARNWILSGSSVSLHNCTHDDQLITSCVVDNRVSK